MSLFLHVQKSPYCYLHYTGTFDPQGREACQCGWVSSPTETEMNTQAKIALIRSCGYWVRECTPASPVAYIVVDPTDSEDGWMVAGGEKVLDETIQHNELLPDQGSLASLPDEGAGVVRPEPEHIPEPDPPAGGYRLLHPSFFTFR
jgi:hypothetical protein